MKILGAQDGAPHELSRYRGQVGATCRRGDQHCEPVVDGNIFNSGGVHVAIVTGPDI